MDSGIAWVALSLLMGAPAANELNWLRNPPEKVGALVWKGAIPRDEHARLGRQKAGWSKSKRRQLGRAVLRILHRVWKAYAEQFELWKKNYGIEQWEWVQKQRIWQRQRAQVTAQQLYRRTRLELCMGEQCRNRRGLGEPQERRVSNLPF